MKRYLALPFSLIALCLAACGATHGWAPGIKETMIDSCIKEAKSRGAPLADDKISAYCSCYQQNVQKAFPDSADLQKAKTEELSKAAEPCLDAALK